MSGIGLAYKTPEQQAAVNLDSAARAVSQPAPSPGIGLATVPAPDPRDFDGGAPVMDVIDPQSMAVATPDTAALGALPAIAEAAPETPKAKPLIDYKENPLGAIGLVLQSVAAGYAGDPSPVEALKARQLEEAAMQYKTAALGMEVIDKTAKFVAKLPSGKRAAAIADMDKRFSPALGGQSIAPFLTAITSGDEMQAAARMDLLKEMNISPAQMAYFGQNPDAAMDFIDKALEHKATTKTPDELKAERIAQNEADSTKPMTPAEKAADARSREANAATRATAAATREAAVAQRSTSQENTLRGDYANQSKNFVIVRDAFQKVKSAAENGASDKTGAADLSLIFGYMKMLDPPSSVREGEQATAQNSGGVGENVRNLYNSVVSGKRLTETQRKDFANNATRIHVLAQKNQSAVDNHYKGIATRTGANPENVIGGIGSLPVMESPDEAAKLPKGTHFLTPDGQEKIVP